MSSKAATHSEILLDLLDRCTVRLSLYIRRRGGRSLSPDVAAEDILQETLYRTWEHRSQLDLDDPERLYQWMVAVAGNIIRDRRRYVLAKGRNRVRHIESAHDDFRVPIAAMTSVEKRLERREQIERVDFHLSTLDDDSRRIVELYYLEGRRLVSIAKELGLPKSTVWDRLSKGIDSLKAKLDEKGLGS